MDKKLCRKVLCCIVLSCIILESLLFIFCCLFWYLPTTHIFQSTLKLQCRIWMRGALQLLLLLTFSLRFIRSLLFFNLAHLFCGFNYPFTGLPAVFYTSPPSLSMHAHTPSPLHVAEIFFLHGGEAQAVHCTQLGLSPGSTGWEKKTETKTA